MVNNTLYPEVDYSKYKEMFKDLYEEFVSKGLLISQLDYDLILKLLDYIKNNYEASCLILNEILELYDNKDVIRHALLKDFSFIDRKSKKVYERYREFFDVFDGRSAEEFLSKFDDYISFLFYIAYNVNLINEDKREEYFKRVTENLNEINKLDIDYIYLNFPSNITKIGEIVKLYYQPEGEIKNEYLSRIFYREDDVFSDGFLNEQYDLNNDCVLVFFYLPRFIIKTVRKKGFRLESGGNFDEKTKEMVIYDLMFESRYLPSKDELRNSRCTLEAYEQLIHTQKLKILKEKLIQLGKQVCDMEINIDKITSLFDELGINFDEENDFYHGEIKELALACNKVKNLRKF